MLSNRNAAAAAGMLVLAFAVLPAMGADDMARGRELMRRGQFDEAAKVLQPLADGGDMWAQFQLARLYAAGLGVPEDAGRAVQLYAQAAQAGHREARFALGWALHTGDGVARDDAQAARWWRLAANDGHPRAQYHLAELLLAGQGVPADRGEAERLLRMARAQGDTGAAVRLAALKSDAAAPAETIPAAVAQSAPAAKVPPPPAGSPLDGPVDDVSRWVLRQSSTRYTVQVAATPELAEARAIVTDNGLEGRAAVVRAMGGGEPLYKVLVGLFDTRAEGRDALTALPAGVRARGPWLRQLAGVQAEIRRVLPADTRDGAAAETPAEEKTAMAAPAGEQRTPDEAGDNGQSGGGVEVEPGHAQGEPSASPEQRLRRAQAAFNAQRYEEAYAVWMPLARDGLAPAQYGVAFLLESGWGTSQDFERAVQWYRAAAEQGHAKAQFNLGLMYLSGQGAPRDDSLAVYWIQSAAENGDPRAQEYLNRAGGSSQ